MNSTVEAPAEQATEQVAELIRIDDIDLQASPMVRACDSDDTIKEMWNLLIDGAKYPPVHVFLKTEFRNSPQAEGQKYLLVDGRHRYFAHNLNNEQNILAVVHHGTEREALEFALGANSKHGLPLSQADVKCALEIILKDPEWCQLSNYLIGQMVGRSEVTVRRFRKEKEPDIRYDNVAPDATSPETAEKPKQVATPKARQEQTKRVGRDGKSYPVKKTTAAKTEDDGAAKGPKPGSEIISPEQRKALRDAFGAFVRLTSKVPKWKQITHPFLDAIAELMAPEWASLHRQASDKTDGDRGNILFRAALHACDFIEDDSEKNTSLMLLEDQIDRGHVSFDPKTFKESSSVLCTWDLAEPYKAASKSLAAIKRTMVKIAEDERQGAHLHDKITRITTEIDDINATIKSMTPTAECESCKGEGCKACRQSGFWTKAIVESKKR